MPGSAAALAPTSSDRRRISIAVEGAFWTGPHALGDGGLHRAVGRHRVLRVGAGDALRLVTLYGDPLHRAPRRIIVVAGIMLDRAIVPHHQRVGLPLHPELIFGDRGLAVEELEQRIA